MMGHSQAKIGGKGVPRRLCNKGLDVRLSFEYVRNRKSPVKLNIWLVARMEGSEAGKIFRDLTGYDKLVNILAVVGSHWSLSKDLI